MDGDRHPHPTRPSARVIFLTAMQRPWIRGCGGSDFRRSRACGVASCGRLAQSNRPQPPAPPRPLAAFPKQARRVQCLELELAEVQTLLEKVRVSRPCAGGVMVAHPIAHSAPRRPPGVLSALPPFAPSSAFRRAVPSCRMATRRRWRSRSTCRRAALGLLVAGLGVFRPATRFCLPGKCCYCFSNGWVFW